MQREYSQRALVPFTDFFDSVLQPFNSNTSPFKYMQQSIPVFTLGAVDIVEKDNAYLIVTDTPGLSVVTP